MTSRTIVQLEDDLDGGEATQTLHFSFEGAAYEIDLSDKNADKLHRALDPYIEAARKVGGRRKSAARAKSSSNGGGSPADIREWAQEAGYEVSGRGRVSAAVREAYEAAH